MFTTISEAPNSAPCRSIVLTAIPGKLFKTKIKFLPPRRGERFSSALTRMNLNNKIIKIKAKSKLVDYIKSVVNYKR